MHKEPHGDNILHFTRRRQARIRSICDAFEIEHEGREHRYERLVFENFPKSHNLVLIAQPSLRRKLRLTVNEDIRGRSGGRTMIYPPERKSPARTWTRADIRRARQTPLPPVLEALGYQLDPLPNGNHGVRRPTADACPGGAAQSTIIVKDHYWVNTGDGTAGNAIDFLVDVQGMTFSQAMTFLCPVPGRPGAS